MIGYVVTGKMYDNIKNYIVVAEKVIKQLRYQEIDF